jgi:predicted regulator of Ras-like GTPase activity (Roadblock/LC7/MglB family)
MESLLSEINAVIGVSGSFIGDTKGRILARALPSIYDSGTLVVVARTMSQTFAGLETARRRKVGDMDMVFKEGRLVVKPFGEGFLGIVCVPRFNVALLNMTANVTVRKIHELLKERPTPVAAAPAAAPPAGVLAAPAPARLIANSPRESAALALVQMAGEHKILLRIMGDTAVRLRCPSAAAFPPTEEDEILEFVARGRQTSELEHVMKARGNTADARFNMLHASERLRFVDPAAGLPMEVFLNAFEEYHRLELSDRLPVDEISLPLADLLLLQLQVVNYTPQHQKRILALLADHDIGPGDDSIDPARVVEVCAEDWGWAKTVTMNLEKAIAAAPAHLTGESPKRVETRARRLIQLIEEAPKTLGWQVRSRMGERRPWYNVPE